MGFREEPDPPSFLPDCPSGRHGSRERFFDQSLVVREFWMPLADVLPSSLRQRQEYAANSFSLFSSFPADVPKQRQLIASLAAHGHPLMPFPSEPLT